MKHLWNQWSLDQKIAVLQHIRSVIKDKNLSEKSHQGDYWGFCRDECGKLNNNALVENVIRTLFPEEFYELDAIVTAHEGVILTITLVYNKGYSLSHDFFHFSLESDIDSSRSSYSILINFIDALVKKEDI